MPVAPIHVLDKDIILSIFEGIVSHIPQIVVPRRQRPITAIRASSQVCRPWRALILASPRIWARLIDLQELNGRQDVRWMEEVARRSQLAPLWIYGDVHIFPGGSPSARQYFTRLLESWERIERLSVVIYGNNKKVLDDVQFRILSRAPILKLFDIFFFGSVQGSLFLDTLLPGSSKHLFGNYAPSLVELRARQVAFGLDASWLPNIREISPFPNHLTLEKIFLILQRTPLIERIRIENRGSIWVEPAFSPLGLPNLSSISLSTSASVTAGVMNHIAPGQLRSFDISVQEIESEGFNKPYVLSSFKHTLPSYISNYFAGTTTTTNTNSPTMLTLAITDCGLNISDLTGTAASRARYPHHFELSITVKFTHQRDWDVLLACLLDAFAAAASTTLSGAGNPTSGFDAITELNMCSMVVPPSAIPNLHSMLAVLRRVRVIHIDVEYAHVFLALSDFDLDPDEPEARINPNPPGHEHEHEVLFPHLHTMHLISRGHDNSNDAIRTDLVLFLMKRRKIGFPVAKLDLTKCQRSESFCDLEAVDGLEVVRNQHEDRGGEENL